MAGILAIYFFLLGFYEIIFDDELDKRNQAAAYYADNLHDSFTAPFVLDDYISSWAQYSILAGTKDRRDDMIIKLKEQNIPAMIYYSIPLHLQKVFENLKYAKGTFLVSEDTANRIFSIPMHPYITRETQDKILSVLTMD